MAALRESAPMPNRTAAIYTRVSSPGQKNTTSLPEQERLCRAYAAEQGWQVSESHVYREVEGGQDLYRPLMDRLWTAIEAGQVQGVVIDVLDRLSRDEGDQGAFYHHADRFGVKIALVSEDLDETEHGHTLRSISGIVSRIERADIRRRTQRGRRARAAGGKLFTAPWPLYGYLWADPAKGKRNAYVVDPETAPIVVHIFEAVAAGVPVRRLVAELTAEGVPTPSQVLFARGLWPTEKRDEQGNVTTMGREVSAAWDRQVVLHMIRHPAYIGAHVAYRRQHTNTKERPAHTGVTRKVHHVHIRAADDPAVVALPAATCPALVTRELAEAAQAQLAINRAEQACHIARPDLAILRAGIAVCGYCGGRLTVNSGSHGGDSRRYYCRAWRAKPGRLMLQETPPCAGGAFTMSADKLDAAVWRDVSAWLSDERNVAQLLADWRREGEGATTTSRSHLDATEAQIAGLRQRMGNLAETIANTNDADSRAVLQEKLDATSAELRRETAKRERLAREATEAIKYAKQAASFQDWVRRVASRAATADHDEKRRTLQALGAVVEVWRAGHVDAMSGTRYRVTLHPTLHLGTATILPHREEGAPDAINERDPPRPFVMDSVLQR